MAERSTSVPVTHHDGFIPTGQVAPAQSQSDKEPTADKSNPNEANNVDPFIKMWDTTQTEDKSPSQTVVVEQKEKELTPAEAWQVHIDSLDLGSDVDAATIQADLAEGKNDSLNAALKSTGQKAYRQAILTMQPVMDQKIAAAVTEAVSKAVGSTKSSAALQALNDALPFTKDAAVAPIAKGVMAQFIKNGQPVDQAIESTRQYFIRSNKLSAKDLGLQHPPSPAPGGQPFPGMSNLLDDDDEINWEDQLGGISP